MTANQKVSIVTFIIVLASIISSKINAQSISVLLNESGVYRDERSLKRQTDTTVVVNMPKLFRYWSLRSVAYDPVQGMRDEVIDGKRSHSQFNQFIIKNKIDTTFLSKEKIPRNLIYVFTALDEKGIKYVLIDANNNRDFVDDKMYAFNLNDTEKNYPEIKVAISYFDGNVVKDTWATMKIDAYRTIVPDSYFSAVKDKNLDITMLNVVPTWAGELTVENQRYLISVSKYNEIYKNAPFNIEIAKMVPESKASHSYIFSSKDTLKIGYNEYKLSGFNKPVLTLDYINRNNASGAEMNTIAPAIKGNDMITNLPFSLEKLLGKYVLVDFWGSWCGPCIKAIPELKNMYKLYKNSIEFISVAHDKPEDLDKLKQLIHKYNMTWHHLYDNMKPDKSIIAKEYKVQEYPTSILIDPKGKVVFRSVGEAGLRDLVGYLTMTGIIGAK